jgi:hypothetical protein
MGGLTGHLMAGLADGVTESVVGCVVLHNILAVQSTVSVEKEKAVAGKFLKKVVECVVSLERELKEKTSTQLAKPCICMYIGWLVRLQLVGRRC